MDGNERLIELKEIFMEFGLEEMLALAESLSLARCSGRRVPDVMMRALDLALTAQGLAADMTPRSTVPRAA